MEKVDFQRLNNNYNFPCTLHGTLLYTKNTQLYQFKFSTYIIIDHSGHISGK